MPPPVPSPTSINVYDPPGIGISLSFQPNNCE
jgi:hypothetical protein